jgi:phage terminase large subunit GpA-like protein
MGATDQFIRTLQEAIKPDERLGVAAWAEKHRILPENSPEPGKWRNSRTPYLVGIMDALSGLPSQATRYAHDDAREFDNSWVVEVYQMKGHQVGGSAAGENFIGRAITSAAGNILAVFATNDDAEKWEIDRFEPMRASTPELRKRVKDSGTKGSDNTKRRKRFPGGMLNLVSATRAGRLKSTTVRYVYFEEPDEYDHNVDDQGSPIDLARNRTSNFGRRAKIYGNGTPTLDGASHIQKLHNAGDQRKYFVHCPCCGSPQYFDWKRFKWQGDDFDSVLFYCNAEGCGVGSAEHEWKTTGYEGAYWMPTAAGDGRTASFHLPSMYAPIGWRPWADLARAWHAAQGDTEKLIDFTNNELGEPYRETSGKEVKAEQLADRAEAYLPMTCPRGGLIAVAGVDTQDNRLAVTIRAYGRGQESWGLFHDEIYGSPSDPQTWKKVEQILLMPIRHESGQLMRVEAACVDTGGHHTHDVYAFCKTAQARGRHWLAIRGAKPIDAPILGKPKVQQFNYLGQPVPGGVQLRQVGTQAIKTKIDYRLREITSHGPGFLHFPMAYSVEYFRQMRSEKQVWVKDTAGKRARVWKNPSGSRNEAWDCEVYAYAAFAYLTSSNESVAFALREKIFGIDQADLFAVPAQAAHSAVAQVAQREADAPNAPVGLVAAHDVRSIAAPLPDVSPLSPLNPLRAARRGRRMASRGIGT